MSVFAPEMGQPGPFPQNEQLYDLEIIGFWPDWPSGAWIWTDWPDLGPVGQAGVNWKDRSLTGLEGENGAEQGRDDGAEGR